MPFKTLPAVTALFALAAVAFVPPADAARRSGRGAEDVELLAVCKGFPAEVVREAVLATGVPEVRLGIADGGFAARLAARRAAGVFAEMPGSALARSSFE